MLPADGDDSTAMIALLKAVRTLRNASDSFRDRSLPLLIIATFDIVPRILFSPLLFPFLSLRNETRRRERWRDGQMERQGSSIPLSLSLSIGLTRLRIKRTFRFDVSRRDQTRAFYRRRTTFCDCYLLNCGHYFAWVIARKSKRNVTDSLRERERKIVCVCMYLP